MFLQGGPGGIVASMPGGVITDDSWKCAGFNANENPDVVYPDWNMPEYDDSEWLSAKVRGTLYNRCDMYKYI